MTDDTLRIRRLHVRRTPGITDGGFVLDSLSPGVNVVFGPNGSGKSTTADAIESALWPMHATKAGVSLTARFGLRGAQWHVDLDSDRIRVQCDGQDDRPPALPAAESRHRYRLHLHELLSPDHAGADFARLILRESSGGYDVRATADGLKLTMPGAQSGQREWKELAQARARLREARERQRGIAVEAERLRELEAEIEVAQAARARVALLDAALEQVRALRARDESQAALDRFDPRCAHIGGHEAAQLRELDERVRGTGRDADAAQATVQAADAEMRRLLPEGELPEGLLPALRAELRTIEELRRQHAAEEKALRVADDQRAAITGELGAGVTEERLAAIDIGAMRGIAALAGDIAQLQAERVALQGEIAALEASATGDDEEALRRGMRALEEWLAAPEPAGGGRVRLLGLATAALLLVGGALVAWRVHPGAWAVALLALLALVLIGRERPPADPRPDFAEAYRRLEFPAPSAWTRDAVTAALEALRRRAAEARAAESRAEQRARLTRRLTELDPRGAELERRRADMAARLGLAPDAAAATLLWIVERLLRWQAARDVSAAARAALAVVRADHDARCSGVFASLAPYGAPPSRDDATLVGAVDALAGRTERHAAARQQRELARQAHRTAMDAREHALADRAALLQRLELAEQEQALLEGWTASLDGYREARAEATRAEVRWRSTEAALRSAPGFQEELLEQGALALEGARAEAAGRAAEYEQLVDARAKLDARVQLAKTGSEVAAALAEERRCEDALTEARDRDAERAVGAALVEHLLATTRDQQRPAVFHRARELFLDVTHERYRLDLADGDEPAFFAHDTTSDVGYQLHELSSATRVQLLLCVRLAFVETQENGGARLPLLLDETLGTSDDARAQAIIDAVLSLASNGRRQVFYFTAQQDEVAKWMGMLQTRSADGRLIDLAECRRLTRPCAAVVLADVPDRAAPPEPAGRSHRAYGELLRVPAIDRAVASIGGAHLWHVTDDPEALHALLRLRFERWGPLESLLDRHGDGALGEMAAAAPRLRAAAAALREAHRLARIGHGRRVDYRALEDSGAVSATFMDRVVEACERVDGDAERLLAFLENGLERFQARTCDRLRSYFLEHGYLAPDEPLSRGEITTRTLVAVAMQVDQGLITRAHVERIVAAVLPVAASVAGDLPIVHVGLAVTSAVPGAAVIERN